MSTLADLEAVLQEGSWRPYKLRIKSDIDWSLDEGKAGFTVCNGDPGFVHRAGGLEDARVILHSVNLADRLLAFVRAYDSWMEAVEWFSRKDVDATESRAEMLASRQAVMDKARAALDKDEK